MGRRGLVAADDGPLRVLHVCALVAQGNRMNILLPRNALLRTLFPRGRKSGTFLPAIFTSIVAAEHNFHSIALARRV
jgi:hypothetical protein